ncbi:TALPID3 protein-like [Argopecten irradians]|uniref:TALPID3 protein-like n=1 Tax=Argopecten irradians TaxID=31199 RepID=UPI00371BB46B
MAQSSMLELLALTDAAVKGLDKSTRSSSASSHSSRASIRKSQYHDYPSHDSGICKTNTVTDKTGGHIIHDSDESTTASDVLITSTTVDPADQRSFLLQDRENLSNVSKCSKISIGSENFNTSGAQKVKISTKRLREIKSPFDVSTRSREIKENVKDSVSAVKKAGKSTEVLDSAHTSNINSDDKNLSKNAITKPVVSKTSKVQSAPRGLSEVSKKDDKETDHFFSPMQTQRSETFDEFSPRDDGKELIERKRTGSAYTTPSNTPDSYRVSKQKAAEVFVERHTPKKMTQPDRKRYFEESQSDHGKDPTLDLSGSVDLLPEKEVTSPCMDMSGGSRESSQPEIFTVPERIVTVSARTSLSTDASLNDTGPGEENEKRIPPMLSARYQLGSKMNGGVLQQGAPVEGSSGLDKRKESPEVKISNFKMSEKQKLIRQTFAKRYEHAGPVKRVVQPKIVGADRKASEVKGEGPKVTGQTSEAIAVAVAASAAVAATQPFLKAQQDLESKMTEILEKMAVIQNNGSAKQMVSETETAVQESQRVMALEKQLTQLTDQRIEHLERLQEHQLQMQAKLISLTRETSKPRSAGGSPQRTPPKQRKFPSPGSDLPRRAFSKTTVNRTSVSPKGSSLDTPAPRSRAPRPVAYDPSVMADTQSQQSKGILEEILDSAGSPTRSGQEITIHQPVYTRQAHHERSRSKSPNVKKAEKLVQELSELKDQMTDLVFDVNNSAGKKDKLTMVEPPSHGKTAEEILGPSPLDPYLVLPDVVPTSPYKYVPDLASHKVNAPVHTVTVFQDARQVLKQVGKNKEFLEANLESVLRTRQEAEVYSILENLYQESSDTEKARLQHKVNDWVADLRRQVDREVTDEVVLRELQKKHQRPTLPIKEPHVAPTGPKKSYRMATRGTQGARVDTGLKRDNAKSAIGPSVGRIPGPSMGKAPRFTEKETKITSTVRKPPIKGPPPRQPPPVSEENMYKVYGKPVYDNKRTTQKDPYLHYQNRNVPKPRSPGRSPPRAADISGGIEVRSAKSQTKGGVKQFYFSPASGSFIPVADVASAAPIQGQLIPMAVPLGGPRMEGGLAAEVVTSNPASSGPVTSTPMSRPQVTASNNVALVSVPSGEEEEQISPQPELAKQVLPPVDIDTDLSEQSVVRSKTGDIHMKSPSKTHYEVTFHDDQQTGATPKDWRNQATLDDLSEDLSPETAPGLALPGYSAPSPPPTPVEIPAFPPMVSGADKLAQASDLIAADIRRRDLLENKASEWIEHEIMAHIISELYPLKPEKPREMEHVVYEESETSLADDREQSMFMMDAIGRDGLQMFVDMGQPVDSRLVDALVKEVLLEKVTTLLGQRPDDERTVQREATEGRTEAKLGASTRGQDTGRVTTGVSPEDEYAGMLPTPEPTPKASPISSPARILSPPVTPPSSPPVKASPQKFVQEPRVAPPEPEPEEISESLDISEEIRALRNKLVPIGMEPYQTIHDVETPISTPVPELPQEEEKEEERPLTPPQPSPRRPPVQPVLQVSMSEPEPPIPEPVPPPIQEKKADIVVATPQPWGDPDSPLPEENPDFRDDYMDDGANQHKPYALSVAPMDESLPHPMTQVPSPPPKSPVRRSSPSPSPSETETTSIMSSVSDTYNMSVSEGQWLLSKSEGEMADFNLDEAAMKRMALQARHTGDSMASTVHDTSELEEDMTDLQASEGEFQYKGHMEPEKDPMLLLLSRLHRQPHEPTPVSIPAAGQYDMSSQQVYDLLNHTGLSTGEVYMNGASVQRSQGEVIRVMQTQRSMGEVPDYDQPTRDTNRQAVRSKYGFNQSNGTSRSNDISSSPLRMTDLKSQSIQEESEPEPTPRDDLYHDDSRSERVTPSRDARPSSSRGRQSPGIRGTPGGVSLGAGRISPGKSAMKKPPPATPSSGLPNKTISTTVPRSVQIRESDEQENRQSLDGGATMSDQGTRTFTPDQMNMDDLIKSGYLTMSRSGEFGQSGGMSQSFGQSGRLSQSYDQSSAMSQSLDRNGTRDSTDSYVTRQINKGKSLGLTYSMEESLAATDSLDESELRQLATTGTLKMSVRMPTLGDMEDDSEKQSEFEMTDTM